MFECPKCGEMPMRRTVVGGTEVVCQGCGATTGTHLEPKDAWDAWKNHELTEGPSIDSE